MVHGTHYQPAGRRHGGAGYWAIAIIAVIIVVMALAALPWVGADMTEAPGLGDPNSAP